MGRLTFPNERIVLNVDMKQNLIILTVHYTCMHIGKHEYHRNRLKRQKVKKLLTLYNQNNKPFNFDNQLYSVFSSTSTMLCWILNHQYAAGKYKFHFYFFLIDIQIN